MPIVFVLALIGSLAIHGAALFGTDVELFGGGPEPVPLQAELQPPPAAPVEAPRVKSKPPRTKAAKKHTMASARPAPATVPAQPEPDVAPETAPATSIAEPAMPPPPPPARPLLPAEGVIRFAIFKESLGFQVGRAEHRWVFAEDGSYRLTGMTETSGLAALLKPVRLEIESRGRLVAGGLQPETLRSLKNGQDANENADFDWSSGAVRLSRDGSVRPIAPGAQDILSLNFQLAYLKKPEDGSSIGVVTGKKYERYGLDSLGEEEIDVPAGHFRTLHLRAQTDNVTEIWIALDHHRLPVKIRFTDKKGESFEQVATELGLP
ncbi:DUF3108 domain-containing protein [Dechloromonas denitrificans]|uniref:DUF3108 domain-containing protein n=1 Tax=Dechloromonas denitrificans TaxID=281362 RepID=UPI001CFB3307|nr:DUF3108 domain-containing protein [Dechloromonas denitrificans]UCV09244.1 DUF3108 domain-containing protein [Dechloromonas denitrificans]